MPAKPMMRRFFPEISGHPEAIRNGMVTIVPVSIIQPMTELLPIMRIERDDNNVLQANITALPRPKMSAIRI